MTCHDADVERASAGRKEMMKRNVFGAVALTLAALTAAVQSAAYAGETEKVGVRPYEMEWAGRTEEVRTPLVDFENLDGWKVVTRNTVASFERSREEQMYGSYVGKLTYRCEGEEVNPYVDIVPPAPIPVAESGVNAYSCWIVGNNWGWTVDPTTPRVAVALLLTDASGVQHSLPFETVDWKEWFLCYRVIPTNLLETLGDGASFTGIRVSGGRNTEDRTLFFDSLCVFKETREPLEFSKRPKPGIDLFEGQDLGVNTGEGRLPFPTTPDTILPDSSKNLRKPATHFYGDGCDFVYEGSDGTLVYEYKPRTGNWSDIQARWNMSDRFHPCVDGGVNSLVGASGAAEPVTNAELLELVNGEGVVSARWKLSSETASAEVEYRFRNQGKSLIIDTIAKGGNVPEVLFGRVEDVAKAKVFTSPYYLYDYSQRPGFGLLTTKSAKPERMERLFASAHIDWYRSGASYLRGRNGSEGATATLNGGAEYRVKTNGERNDVYERFIITFSPEFDEVLPTIANPASPYREVAGKGVWRAHGANTRDGDKRYWTNFHRHGIRNLIVTDHEVCWRDGGESFTFRTKPAPKKGGDEGWFDYARFMQDKLGYVYGPYNNFTDFAPVNEYWSPDMVNRGQDWALQRAWMRCYAPKPIRAVEYCEKLTPIVEDKFRFTCAYCDVHSSVPPWTRTDYDERVPGAGTFMSVFYPYGEIFLIQKRSWDGPTYSEGPHHCFYAGLTDGNYGQDQPYNMFVNPWLVDFDLRKIHDLEVDFGMGNPGMFAPGYSPANDEERSALIDRFLAATLAFGHSGFFAADYGLRLAGRSYFMVQQIASYYTQTSADTIRYFDADGVGYATSDALERDLVSRSQLCVTYKDGTTVVANGSTKEGLRTTIDGREIALPPNGYVAWSGDGKVLVESFFSDSQRRFDYCESPDYVWLDGRGAWVERNLACGDGAALCRMTETAGEYEIIPYDEKEVGFKVAGDAQHVAAVALDAENNELGPASIRRSRGFVFVQPVPGAVSYKLTVTDTADADAAAYRPWSAPKFVVAPGETVAVTQGDRVVDVQIPAAGPVASAYVPRLLGLDAKEYLAADALPYVHIWTEPAANEALDFLVATPALYAFRTDPDGNVFFCSVSDPDASERPVAVAPEQPAAGGEETCVVSVKDGDKELRYALTFDVAEAFVRYPYDFETAANMPTAYIQRRGEEPTKNINGSGAGNYMEITSCGGVKKHCRRLHPPYLGGPTGKEFVEFAVDVPDVDSCAFRMSPGKTDGSDLGDGIIFRIEVRLPGEKEATTLAETHLAECKWTTLEADLSQYRGQSVMLRITVDPNENTYGDWACVAEPRLESDKPFLKRVLRAVEPVGN